MHQRLGRILTVGALGFLFFAYLNFAPTSLSSSQIADYVKNHFVREMIFGIALTAWTIRLALQPLDVEGWKRVAGLGSVVVLPFWIASLFGWSTGGMAEVWGDAVPPAVTYALHGTQVACFYAGLFLLRPTSE